MGKAFDSVLSNLNKGREKSGEKKSLDDTIIKKNVVELSTGVNSLHFHGL